MDKLVQKQVLDYRMDSKGRIFARHVDSSEREIVNQRDKSDLLVMYPEIALSLSNKG